MPQPTASLPIEPLLTTRQCADILQQRETGTITKLIRAGALKAIYVGTRWLVAPAALREFIAAAPSMQNTTSRMMRQRLAHAL